MTYMRGSLNSYFLFRSRKLVSEGKLFHISSLPALLPVFMKVCEVCYHHSVCVSAICALSSETSSGEKRKTMQVSFHCSFEKVAFDNKFVLFEMLKQCGVLKLKIDWQYCVTLCLCLVEHVDINVITTH